MSSCSLVDVTLSGNFVCWIRGPLWSDRCPFCLLMSFVFVCVCVCLFQFTSPYYQAPFLLTLKSENQMDDWICSPSFTHLGRLSSKWGEPDCFGRFTRRNSGAVTMPYPHGRQPWVRCVPCRPPSPQRRCWTAGAAPWEQWIHVDVVLLVVSHE